MVAVVLAPVVAVATKHKKNQTGETVDRVVCGFSAYFQIVEEARENHVGEDRL